MERLGVGDHDRRDQPDVLGERRHPGGEENRVEPATNLIGASIRQRVARVLQCQRVFDRHEIEQPALGLGHQPRPVAGIEQLIGPGIGLAPRGWMPARSVERDREMQLVRL